MRKRLMPLILIFVLFILAASGCGQPPAPAPTATQQLATVAPTATTAPSPTLAPTDTLVPTDTPVPTATPEPTATKTPIPATATQVKAALTYQYSDDFSDLYSGWPMDVGDDATYGYVDGAYAIVINAAEYIMEVVPENYLGTGDAVIEVDAWKDAGSDNGDFGIICGFQDYENYFAMGISTDGSVSVFQRANDEESELFYQERGFSPADRYHLVANCQKGHYTLEVNGKIVINLEDPLLSSDGKVGIFGGAFEKGPFIYYFDDFKVEQFGKLSDDGSEDIPTAAQMDTGEVWFSDDFSNKDGDWYEFSSDNSASAYENGYYTINVKNPMYAQWNLPRAFEGIGNARVEVDARLMSGPDKGDFGIICGYKNNSNFHVLAIANDGYAEILRWVDGDDDIFASKENAFTPAEEYHLAAICADGQLSLSVNGVEVLSASSEYLDDMGQVGLYGGTFDEGFAVYAFDNFVVRDPSASAMNAGKVVFSDDFSNKDGGWKEVATDDVASAYQNGQYLMTVNPDYYAQWKTPQSAGDPGDAVVEVDAGKVSGPDTGDFGIYCGYKDNKNFYYLAITNDGYAEIVRRADGEEDTLASKENAYKTAKTYHLTASCTGGTLRLGVNGQEVLSAEVEGWEDAGKVGLYAGTFKEGNAVFAFDNFIIREP